MNVGTHAYTAFVVCDPVADGTAERHVAAR
jgi:hypothetical protein